MNLYSPWKYFNIYFLEFCFCKLCLFKKNTIKASVEIFKNWDTPRRNGCKSWQQHQLFTDRLMKKVPSLAKEKKSKEMCMILVGATSMPLIIFLDFSLSEAWDKRITYSNFPPLKPNFNWGKQAVFYTQVRQNYQKAIQVCKLLKYSFSQNSEVIDWGCLQRLTATHYISPSNHMRKSLWNPKQLENSQRKLTSAGCEQNRWLWWPLNIVFKYKRYQLLLYKYTLGSSSGLERLI